MAPFNPYILNVPNPWDVLPAYLAPTPLAPESTPELMPMLVPAPMPMLAPASIPCSDDFDMIVPINAPRRTSYDAVDYGLRPWPPTMEPTIAGLGIEPTGTLDLVGMMRDMHEGYINLAPTIDFFGNHPIMTLTLILGAIVLGGAVGGYIGAGYKATSKGK